MKVLRGLNIIAVLFVLCLGQGMAEGNRRESGDRTADKIRLLAKEHVEGVRKDQGVESLHVIAENRPLEPETTQKISEVMRDVYKHSPKYSAYSNCTTFALLFHRYAQEKNIPVRTLGAKCDDSRVGHAFNMVKVQENKWIFIDLSEEETAKEGFKKYSLKQESFENPNNPTEKALCQIMGRELDKEGKCPCIISENLLQPESHNRNPFLSCALNSDFLKRRRSVKNFRDCLECCQDSNAYHISTNTDLSVRWSNECISGCRNHLLPKSEDSQELSSPRRNDTLGIATGRACLSSTSFWKNGSRKEQCRGCCLDGARNNYFPKEQLSSCQAVCSAEYGQ